MVSKIPKILPKLIIEKTTDHINIHGKIRKRRKHMGLQRELSNI